MNDANTATPELIFVTTNQSKFNMAKSICDKNGLALTQVVTEIDEIQGEDPEVIARDKAQRAFQAVGKPVVIGDDSWSFSGLNGFPGAYMKSISNWLTPEKFMDLMQHVEDRRATLIQYLVYQDESETVIFRKDSPGQIVREPRGNYGVPIQKICVLDSDSEAGDNRTLSEIIDAGEAHTPERVARHPEAWHDLAVWYLKKHSK